MPRQCDVGVKAIDNKRNRLVEITAFGLALKDFCRPLPVRLASGFAVVLVKVGCWLIKLAARIDRDCSRSDVSIAWNRVLLVVAAGDLQACRFNRRTVEEGAIWSVTRETLAKQIRFVIAVDAIIEVVTE